MSDDEQIRHLTNVAEEALTVLFPAGWTLTVNDDPDEPTIAFRMEGQLRGVRQTGGVRISRLILDRVNLPAEDVVRMEFRAVRDALDHPAREKALKQRRREAERTAAAVRGMRKD